VDSEPGGDRKRGKEENGNFKYILRVREKKKEKVGKSRGKENIKISSPCMLRATMSGGLGEKKRNAHWRGRKIPN